jgi:hypothetical protein
VASNAYGRSDTSTLLSPNPQRGDAERVLAHDAARVEDETLRLEVRDDGVGGARPSPLPAQVRGRGEQRLVSMRGGAIATPALVEEQRAPPGFGCSS